MASEILNEDFFMRRAIELAKLGEGWTNPNPLVGAVIVKEGKIIGEGWHHKYGELHAEREAILDCKKRGFSPEGATIYVTLEPCAHFGKQPPCCHALVEEKFSQVVVGSRDPNPLVSGKGNAYLREHGLNVREDFLREECDKLNPIFFHYISTKKPYVALKFAMTLDGKIATKTGSSKWITGEESRNFVHHLRNKYAAILCGINTVLSDDPLLTCRLKPVENSKNEVLHQNFQMGSSLPAAPSIPHNPIRIILDSSLRLPVESSIAKTAKEVPTIVVCKKIGDEKNCSSQGAKSSGTENCSTGKENFSADELISRKAALEKLGIEVLELPENKFSSTKKCADDNSTLSTSNFDLSALLEELGQRKIDSILVEGGGTVNYSFIRQGLADKIYAFVAPKIFGGRSKSPVEGEGVELAKDAFNFKIEETKQFGSDILIVCSRAIQ